jgi:hypothetical protein
MTSFKNKNYDLFAGPFFNILDANTDSPKKAKKIGFAKIVIDIFSAFVNAARLVNF